MTTTAGSSSTRTRDRDLSGGGEFAFSEKEFRHIAKVLGDETGIRLTNEKTTLVYSRLAKRLRALGLKSFRDYCELIDSEEGAAERMAMMSALTTNVTRFFREPHHFDHLRTNVLEPMADRIRAGGRLRLWSAACSSGEEPYSIALTVLSVLPNAASLDVRILATDIDPVIVEKARAGIYPEQALANVPGEMKRPSFERTASGAWTVKDEVRQLIAFKELNLLKDWPMKGPFNAIFCRNVVIYFDEQTQNVIWTRFHPLLDHTGRLYVGHSERVGVPGFKLDANTTYRKEPR